VWYHDPNTGNWLETPPVAPSQLTSADGMGTSIVVDQLTVWIGAPRRDVAGQQDAGSVFAYRFDPGTWTWTFQEELTAMTPMADGFFGWSLSKRGPVGFVGASGDGVVPGRVYVLRRKSGAWVEDQVIIDPTIGAFDFFGFNLANDGDLAVVTDGGSAWILSLDTATGLMVFDRDLATVTNLIPTSVAIEGQTVVLGAQYDGLAGDGRVGVIRRPPCSGGKWVQTHELKTIYKHQGIFVELGNSVAVDGDRVLAGMSDYLFIGGPATVAATVLTMAMDCDGNGRADVCDIAAGAQDLDEDGVLDACEAVGTRYCSPNVPNSTGAPSWMLAQGSNTVGHDRLVLTMGGLPQNQFGLFLAGRSAGFVPNPGGSQGNLCIGQPIARVRVPGHTWWNSGMDGVIHGILDLTHIPLTPFVPVLPGETWYFQGWHRDGVKSNFTDAVSVLFQ